MGYIIDISISFNLVAIIIEVGSSWHLLFGRCEISVQMFTRVVLAYTYEDFI
jgi:hypothetical protein